MASGARSEIMVFDQRTFEEREYWLKKLSDLPGPSLLRSDFAEPRGAIRDEGVLKSQLGGKSYQRLMKLTGAKPFLIYTTYQAVSKVM